MLQEKKPSAFYILKQYIVVNLYPVSTRMRMAIQNGIIKIKAWSWSYICYKYKYVLWITWKFLVLQS